MKARRALAAVLVAAALLGSAGCAEDPAPGTDDPARAHAAQQRLLSERARAIRTHDRALFLRGLDHGDRRFLDRQRRYFDGLAALPVAKLRYRLLDEAWPDALKDPGWGAVALPRVRVVLQLAGYDAAPSRSVTGFAFALRQGAWRIVSDRTVGGGFFPGYQPQPWDLVRVRAQERDGVLVLFDGRTRAQATEVLDAVEEGVGTVRAALPFGWDGRVVVYAFADPAVLRSFADVPGGNIEHLGALSFPVRAGRTPVGMRFMVLPSSLRAGQPFLGRIVRHELTHVALAERDDGVPTWLAEGIAEYLGARPLPLSERRIASVAVSRAALPVSGMPSSQGFNGPDQDWHYALSWMACDHIAATRGEASLWELMTALHREGAGAAEGRQDKVLRHVLGYDGRRLAEAAATRIRTIYG